MTQVTMIWDRLRLLVDGHAGHGSEGNDIVCAAESMLVSALIGALEDAQERGRLNFGWKRDGAKVIVWADPNISNLNECKAYFRMCAKGFRMLQGEYPENVAIKEVM